MKLSIKNMVCNRCIMVVRQQLEEAGIHYKNVQLGEVELINPISGSQLESLKQKFSSVGFEILDDHKSEIVSRIKSAIIKLIHQSEDAEFNKKLSAFLSESLNLDYSYLSTLFSSVEGITIEKYAILQRIEKVKELITYDEKNLNEIAFDLGYSSVQHLSQQFKKITGLTPSQFKQNHYSPRRPLDKIGE